MIEKFIVGVLHALCLATIAVPPALLVRVGACAAAPTGGTVAVPDAASLEAAFDDEAQAQGLHSFGPAQQEEIGPGSSKLTMAAGVALPQQTSPTFYWQRTLFFAAQGGGEVLYAYTDLRARYAQPHVTLEIIDHFLPAFDTVLPSAGGLAGTEVRRTATFDSANLEALAAAQMQQPSKRSRAARQSELRSAMDETSYAETVTIVQSDGSQQTYAAGQANLAAALGLEGGGAADLTIDCITGCFNEFGGGIGFLTAACLVAGLVVCGVACAATAGVACIPCIGGAGTVCGVAIGVGSLAFCIAKCINPNYVPTPTKPPAPTPTFVPTATPLSGCRGDCNGDSEVTIDELIRSVNIALGAQPLSSCWAADVNHDAGVTVDEIVDAVNEALKQVCIPASRAAGP